MKRIIKSFLKKVGLFEIVKKSYKSRKKLSKKYVFEGKIKNLQKVCFVLAGYKSFSYEIVFKRIKKFIPDDIEVCILSSGKYSTELSQIAKGNDWSYLSTKRNNVSLIQNIAIDLFKSAIYIYKLDEDIFVTKGFFETLFKTMEECEKNGEYRVGFVAPTIPINGFGHLNILKRFNLVQKYEEMYEKPIYAAGRDRMVEYNPDVAKFFWGEGNYLPQLDKMNDVLSKDEFKYIACPIRFSIGAILFKRDFWEKMDMFKVVNGAGMGLDEEQVCEYAINHSEAIIVSLNSVVGHLSFRNQNDEMKKYFLQNTYIFDIND